MKKTTTRLTALVLALSLLLTSCGGGATAATMHLRKTQGTVGVSDNEGKNVEPKDNLGLYSGYQVGTQAESYAWIDLDKVKLTKLDANSEIEVAQEGKKLEIEVKSGSLFFNVTEPLADDETMDIATSTMVIGIRGTCGWVGENTAALLEGTVTVTAGDQEVTVSAGEMATVTAEGKLEVKPLSAASVPAFVREEIADNEDLATDIQDTTGMDLTVADPMAAYEDVMSRIGGERLVKEFIDFEGDGSPELMLITGGNGSLGLYIMRSGRDRVLSLVSLGSGDLSSTSKNGTLSLVESNGQLFVRWYECYYTIHHNYDSNVFHYASDSYLGSVAQSDGENDDWGEVNRCELGYNERHGNLYYTYIDIYSHNEKGLVTLTSEVDQEDLYDYQGDDPAAYEAVQGKYTLVRELVHYDGESVTVVEP